MPPAVSGPRKAKLGPSLDGDLGLFRAETTLKPKLHGGVERRRIGLSCFSRGLDLDTLMRRMRTETGVNRCTSEKQSAADAGR